MKKVVRVVVLLAALIITVCVTPVSGGYGYTPVSDATSPEKDHAEILADIYGGPFTADGENYLAGGPGDNIDAFRVYDFDDEFIRIHVLNGGPGDVDQIWTDGTVTVTAEAKYASYEQSFGWNGGGLGTTYTELLTDADVGNGAVEFIIGGDFLLGYQATSQSWWDPGLEWWSLNSENHSTEDHLVTYFIDGASADETVWVVFMEDKRFEDSSPSDLDYNDFVVEVRAIPEPASMLLLGLGALVLLRKRRN